MKLKYSVVVPVYNARGTLNRCVESILNQLRNDVELILVNDGSWDDCAEICDRYSYTCSQIKCILKKNSGVSSARNVGIAAAEGKYIMFVDSDDYVLSDYFSKIDRAFLDFDWDCLLFSMLRGTEERFVNGSLESYAVKEKSDVISKIVYEIDHKTIQNPVNKVYKKEIIEKHLIRFNELLSIAEDWNFNIKYSMEVQSMCRIDDPLYIVCFDNQVSLSRRVIFDYYEQHAIAVGEVRKAFEQSSMSKEEKQPLLMRINGGDYKAIYTKAKIMHRQNMVLSYRLKKIHNMCKEVNSYHYRIPINLYFCVISIPVKLNLALIIDFIAKCLLHG